MIDIANTLIGAVIVMIIVIVIVINSHVKSLYSMKQWQIAVLSSLQLKVDCSSN